MKNQTSHYLLPGHYRRPRQARNSLPWLPAAILAGLLAGLVTVSAVARDTSQAQPPLDTVQLTAGMYRIRAEVARTEGQRELGLMHREALGLNAGMLFVFERTERYCFWMQNTPLPLSIAFIADDGTIVNIANMEPLSEDSHCAAKPVRYALEMTQGWFTGKHIEAGSKIGNEQYFKP